MAELLAASTAAADSADFTLAAGASTTLSLKGTAQPFGTAAVQIKSAGGAYTTIGILNNAQPAQVLTAIGTFRVSKSGGTLAYGVDRD